MCHRDTDRCHAFRLKRLLVRNYDAKRKKKHHLDRKTNYFAYSFFPALSFAAHAVTYLQYCPFSDPACATCFPLQAVQTRYRLTRGLITIALDPVSNCQIRWLRSDLNHLGRQASCSTPFASPRRSHLNSAFLRSFGVSHPSFMVVAVIIVIVIRTLRDIAQTNRYTSLYACIGS